MKHVVCFSATFFKFCFGSKARHFICAFVVSKPTDTRACYHLICNVEKYRENWNAVVLTASVIRSGYQIIWFSKTLNTRWYLERVNKPLLNCQRLSELWSTAMRVLIYWSTETVAHSQQRNKNITKIIFRRAKTLELQQRLCWYLFFYLHEGQIDLVVVLVSTVFLLVSFFCLTSTSEWLDWYFSWRMWLSLNKAYCSWMI